MASRWDRRAPVGDTGTPGEAPPTFCGRALSPEPISGAPKGIPEPGSWSHPVMAACPQVRLSARRRALGPGSEVGEAKVLALRYAEARAPAEPIRQSASSVPARGSPRATTGLPPGAPSAGEGAAPGRSLLGPCPCPFSSTPAPRPVIVAARPPVIVAQSTLGTLAPGGIVTIEDSRCISPALCSRQRPVVRSSPIVRIPRSSQARWPVNIWPTLPVHRPPPSWHREWPSGAERGETRRPPTVTDS